MRWIVFAITLVIGALAVIVPLATHWPEPAAAVGLGIGALVAALWAGIRGLVAKISGSASPTSVRVTASWALDGLDWAVMAGAVILGVVIGVIVQLAT
jgi:hypothetical protein